MLKPSGPCETQESQLYDGSIRAPSQHLFTPKMFHQLLIN